MLNRLRLSSQTNFSPHLVGCGLFCFSTFFTTSNERQQVHPQKGGSEWLMIFYLAFHTSSVVTIDVTGSHSRYIGFVCGPDQTFEYQGNRMVRRDSNVPAVRSFRLRYPIKWSLQAGADAWIWIRQGLPACQP